MTHSLFNIRTRSVVLLLGCSFAFLAVQPFVHAADIPGGETGDVGGLLGVTWANHDAGSHITWGLTTHYKILPQVNVGLYYQRFTNDTTILSAGGAQYTTSYNFIAAEANYLFDGTFQGAYLGGKLGWAITSVNLPNVNDKNNLVFGPAAGYDYMLGANVSIGGQFNILWRTGDPFLTDTNLLALLKYNF